MRSATVSVGSVPTSLIAWKNKKLTIGINRDRHSSFNGHQQNADYCITCGSI